MATDLPEKRLVDLNISDFGKTFKNFPKKISA